MRRGVTVAGAGLVAGLSGCLTTTPDDYPMPPSLGVRYQPLAPALPTSPGVETVVRCAQAEPATPPAIRVPAGLPGEHAAIPDVPPDTPATRAERIRLLDQLFPELPALGPDPMVDAVPGGRAATLDDLHVYARRNSPLLAQASAEVENARGLWIQAGLYPNPTAGFQGDAMANLGSAGQVGGFFNQTIITGGKLRLARAVAHYDFENARLRLHKASADLARQVRADYYAALVAAEAVRVARLVNGFTEEVYRRQVSMVKGGQAAPYEAAALRAVVGQVRAGLIQARTRYSSAWKQLAATLNAPDLPPAPLAGRVDEAAPRLRFDALRDRVFAVHTDLAVARNQIAQAEATLVVERRRPLPNLENNVYFQEDSQVNSFQLGVQVGVVVPVWNRNQGAIIAAKATVFRLARETERVRNDLQRQLADAYERYESARQQLAMYREEILPDLVRAFRGVYRRYEVEPDKVNYNDIVTAQQNLTMRLTDYLTLLNQQWLAASDLAGVVQALDLGELLKDPDPAGPDGWPETGLQPPEGKK